MLQAGYFSMAHLEPIYIKSEFSFMHFFFNFGLEYKKVSICFTFISAFSFWPIDIIIRYCDVTFKLFRLSGDDSNQNTSSSKLVHKK